ncbi:MAG: permease, partial [Candidatus Subteraquimicrobiales bacterium]|nr:permease [Candidatus Subteraquimicrobiales bacterium]
LIEILKNTWVFTLMALPWLLIGYLFAGTLKVFIRIGVLEKHIGKGFKAILYATLIGIPLPLCSCGVIPTALGLRRRGASLGATLSFLIATPVTTVTTLFLLYAFFGLKFLILVLFVEFSIAILTGLLAEYFIGDSEFKSSKGIKCPHCDVDYEHEHHLGLIEKIKEVFRYGFLEMGKDTILWILLGLLGAGLIASLAPEAIIEQYLGEGFLPLVLMVVIGTPMYICSTGSIPFVAALVSKGLTLGGAVVFLIVGPATNLSTFFVLARELGKKTAFVYLSSVIVLSLVFGYLIQLFKI